MAKGDTHTKKHSKNKYVVLETIFANKEEGEFYGRVIKNEGGRHIRVKDIKGEEYLVTVRGNFYSGSKKENVHFSSPDRNEYWVLIQLGIGKNDYCLKHIYNEDDKKKLIDMGELSITQNNVLQMDNTIEDINIDDEFLDNI